MFRNFENVFVDLGSAEAVRAFQPDLAAIATLGQGGLVVTGAEVPGARADFVSRDFLRPRCGHPRGPGDRLDPRNAGALLGRKLGRDHMLAYQASARGGWPACAQDAARVYLVGEAVTFFQATVALPHGGIAPRRTVPLPLQGSKTPPQGVALRSDDRLGRSAAAREGLGDLGGEIFLFFSMPLRPRRRGHSP